MGYTGRPKFYLAIVVKVVIVCGIIYHLSRLRENIYQKRKLDLHSHGGRKFDINKIFIDSELDIKNTTKELASKEWHDEYENKRQWPIKKLMKSTVSTIFSDDFIPDIYKNATIGDTIHICLIAAGGEIAGEIRIFVRSIILHARRADVFFHFVVFKGTEKTIPPIFEEINSAFVNIRYELIKMNLTAYLNLKLHNKVRITHEWSGLYGVGKIFMYDLLQDVNKCIVIDTDTLFGIDPAFLWSEALARLRPPIAVATTWFPGDTYFNSGVMLHNFEYMREANFGNLITMKGCALEKKNGSETFLCYHDQLFLNMIMNDHPELFDKFTISWNLDICFGFRNFTFDSFKDTTTGLFFGVAHFTCLPYQIKNVFKEGKGYVRKNLQDYIDFLEEMDLSGVGDHKVERVYKK